MIILRKSQKSQKNQKLAVWPLQLQREEKTEESCENLRKILGFLEVPAEI